MFGLNALALKIYGAIFIVTIIISLLFFIRDDLKIRVKYNQASQNLIQIYKQQELEKKLFQEVKERQDENFNTQNKALLEMHKNGYLADPNGDNPDWMCASDTGCSKN